MKKIILVIFSFIILFSFMPCAMAQGELYDDLPKIKISNGVQKNYYKSGKLKLSSEVADGKRHGMTTVYDQNGKVKIRYRFKHGKFDQAYLEEPERNYGPFAIFLNFKFWAIVLVCGAGLWFVFMKVLFKNRPI
jgi:uncharacterized protein YxeA